MSNTIDKIRVNGTDYDVGGSGGVTVVTFLLDDSGNITASKTVAEIKDIVSSGGMVLGRMHFSPVDILEFKFEGVFEGVHENFVHFQHIQTGVSTKVESGMLTSITPTSLIFVTLVGHNGGKSDKWLYTPTTLQHEVPQ